MSRVSPTPVEVMVGGSWVRGTVRTCETAVDGGCTAVVSYGGTNAVVTGRFAASHMRSIEGRPGCPAPHDEQCCR